jgi:predicted AAA+ superfamily ATPase
VDTTQITGHAYRPRLIDGEVAKALRIAGAVVIEGARGSGKTMTALNAASSYVLLDDPMTVRRMEVDAGGLLVGERPRLLDEWQLAPDLWNMVRRVVDFSPDRGLFILTGSSIPNDDITRHSGAGRFVRLRQRTMTWSEKSESAQMSSVSLAGLFRGEIPQATSEAHDYATVIAKLLQPGFPELLGLAASDARQRLLGYADDISRVDIQRIADVRHDPLVLRQLLAALARSTASEVAFTTLAADVRAVAPTMDPETAARYVGLLQRLFVVERQRPWTPALRSRGTVRTSSKYRLLDAAFAAALLGAEAEHLKVDVETAGLLFESAAIHDLTVFASSLGGEVRHYRDSNKREIDAVVLLPGGKWGAVEIKLGASRIGSAIESLNATIRDIDTSIVGDPAFRLVITGTGETFVADDGSVTCPLSALAA